METITLEWDGTAPMSNFGHGDGKDGPDSFCDTCFSGKPHQVFPCQSRSALGDLLTANTSLSYVYEKPSGCEVARFPPEFGKSESLEQTHLFHPSGTVTSFRAWLLATSTIHVERYWR